MPTTGMGEQLLQTIASGLKKRHKHFEELRAGNTIHATNLIDFCPREYALCIENKIFYNQPKSTSLAQQVTFSIGRKVEEIIIDALELEQAIVRACAFEHPSSPYPIIGTPDLFAKLTVNTPAYIGDVKSIKPEEFDELIEPKINHICQVSLYLWLAELEKYQNTVSTQTGFLIYVAKTQKQMPIKIFEVERNDNFIDRVKRQLTELKRFSKKGILPERICNSPCALMAKRPCKVVNKCF